jgi:c-di-GMP-binding flagellar brake protein YcgR
MPDREGAERRRHPRVNAKIPVEMRCGANQYTSRAVTEEISLCGCYVKTMFTLDIGVKADLSLWLNDQQIQGVAILATRHPQVGSGIEFIQIDPQDRLKLNEYLSTFESAP